MEVANDIRLEGMHSSVVIRRPAPRVVVLILDGADVGELGDRPFRELAHDLESDGALQLFVDARDALGPSIDVSGRWATWLGDHQVRFDHVTMLTGSRMVRMTANLVRDFSGLGARMRIYKDGAAFDDVLRAACQKLA